MPVDFKPKKNLLSVCVVETDGSNNSRQMQNTSSQLTSALWGMYFHRDCADAGRQSWGLLWGNDVCKCLVSGEGMLMQRPSEFVPTVEDTTTDAAGLYLQWCGSATMAAMRTGIIGIAIKLISKTSLWHKICFRLFGVVWNGSGNCNVSFSCYSKFFLHRKMSSPLRLRWQLYIIAICHHIKLFNSHTASYSTSSSSTISA